MPNSKGLLPQIFIVIGLLISVFAFNGCATIGQHHVATTTRLLKETDHREKEAIAVLDTLEETAHR